jgi:mono/diheme cytochrome c family protein
MLRFTIAGCMLAVVASFTGSARAADAAEGRVTFQRDVLPILAKHCQYCHRPGQVAPMSFLTYETTRPWAAQIKALVTPKKMPPAVGSPHLTVLTRGEGLTQAEITTLVTWVDNGAPRDEKPTPPGQGRKK